MSDTQENKTNIKVELNGEYPVLFESLIAQLQISGGTKTERSRLLFELALDCLSEKINEERKKTGKRFPDYEDIQNSFQD